MPVESDKLDFSQPENEMSKIAEEQRKRLFPRNDYKPENQYSSVHPDAIANGDTKGRGNGISMDVYDQNIGTSVDVTERKDDLKVNKYSTNNPYYTVR